MIFTIFRDKKRKEDFFLNSKLFVLEMYDGLVVIPNRESIAVRIGRDEFQSLQ